MRINNNLMAMNTHRQLGINTGAGAKSIEKLSSGYRINRAGDDAAGLAISEKMRGQIRGLNQASRNSQDGISLIQTAEGALNETQAILQRMRELSVQSANDTNVDQDRTAIQNEIEQLVEEIDRIGTTTEFNTQKLLNGNVSSTSTRAAIANQSAAGTTFTSLSIDSASILAAGTGYTIEAVLDTKELNGYSDELEQIGVDGVEVAASSALAEGQYFVEMSATYTVGTVANTAGTGFTIQNIDTSTTIPDGTFSVSAGTSATSISISFLSETGGTITTSIDVSATTGTFTVNVDLTSINTAYGTIDVDYVQSAVSLGDNLVLTRDTAWTAHLKDSANASVGSGTSIVEGQQDVVIGSGASSVTVDFDTTLQLGEAAFGVKASGVSSAVLKDNTGTEITTQLMSADDDRVEIAEYGITFGTNAISDGDNLSFDVTKTTSDEQLVFQIGANSGQEMSLGIDDMRATALAVDGVDVSTAAGAKTAIDTIDSALNTVSEQRAKLGAVQNRLEHSIKNIDTSAENLQAAESRIRDVDMAKEMMNFTKNNILQQAAQSMLAQANQAPQGVLQLLR